MASKSFEWRPAKLLQDYNIGQDFALLILNQPLKNGVNLRKLWKNSSVRVAADGGANRLHKLSSFHGKYSNLQLIIGDLDSLTPQVRDFYSSQPSPATVIHDADQESTDFAKAINWIRKEYPEGIDIVALGGIGGRVDQGLSQLHHLYLFQNDPDYATGRLFLLSGSSLTFLLKAGSHQIQVREEGEEDAFGKHVGIIPLKEAANITTKGFEWDVENWHTEIGGKLSTSNHILPESQVVSVTTDKGVLFTVALKEGDGDDE
ncbi:thiamine pyrophosphokinase [Fusarium bulbicola]|nr:thiamine pyrophosphokinase [Fusarium bulbicola]